MLHAMPPMNLKYGNAVAEELRNLALENHCSSFGVYAIVLLDLMYCKNQTKAHEIGIYE